MIKVFVSTYAKYNNGTIKGAWLDLSDYADKGEFLKACQDLHNDENDPEFMFQDYDTDLQGLTAFYSESYVDDCIFSLLQDYNDDDLEKIVDFIYAFGGDINEAIENFEDAFMCDIDDLDEYLQHMADDIYPKEFTESGYFDYDKFVRDVKFDISEGRSFTFRSHW